MNKTRTQLMKGETIKCPYCRVTEIIDCWDSPSINQTPK